MGIVPWGSPEATVVVLAREHKFYSGIAWQSIWLAE